MEINGIISLSMGLLAGVMFGIVYSKYEDYSTVHDTKFIAALQANPQAFNVDRENMRGLLQAQSKANNSEGSRASAISVDYAIGGNSFYLQFDQSGDAKGKADSGLLLRNQELAEIATWQTFDPQYDADKLKAEMSVFCVVIIGRSSIPQHGKTSFQTWTKHCNDFIMLSSVDNGQYKVKNVNLPEDDRKTARAWDRTKAALTYAINSHPNHDWYVKVEHDTFVVLENLRYMLLMHQANVPGFAGHVLAGNQKRGSVIALSKEAAGKAVGAFPNCGGLYGGAEDFKELEACLKPVGIKTSRDSRDASGANRFQMVQAKPNLPLNAHTSLDWSWRYIVDPARMGQEGCCRDYPVSFHYLSPNGLYLMEYMVYHMRPFGVGTYICRTEQDEQTGVRA